MQPFKCPKSHESIISDVMWSMMMTRPPVTEEEEEEQLVTVTGARASV